MISIAVSLQAIANPILSNIGNQHIKYLQLDQIDYSSYYPTNGLTEWWDAQWNAGPFKHDATLTQLMPLVDGGNVAEIGDLSRLKQKSIDCSQGGGIVVSNCPSLTKDNRYLIRPVTVVICMKFFHCHRESMVCRLGLTGYDTVMYSNDSFNLRWARGAGLIELNDISPNDYELVTIAQVYGTSTTKYYCNGNVLHVNSCAYWCIGGGISFMCNAAFDDRVVDGEFFNAMIFNRALSNEEIDEIAAINMMRYGGKK